MHIIHPSEIRSLRSELMSSTALTPTQHKGGGFKMVIGIVAAIAIPYAAPIIAKAIGLSAALGSAMAGGALVGAGLGAGAAYAMGTNPLIGAVGGGIGGGIAGAASGAGAGVGGYDLGAGYGAVDPSTGAMVSASGAAPAATGGPGITAFDPYSGFVPGAPGSAEVLAQTGAGGVSQQVPILAQPGAGGGVDVSSQLTGWEGSADSGYGVGMAPEIGTAVGVPAATPAPAAAQASLVPTGTKTFGDRVGDFFSGDMTKFAGVQAGSKLLGNVMAGEPEQTELEKEQLRALQSARAEQGALQADKTKKAGEFYRQAQNLNPDFYGQMTMADEKSRKKRADMARLRGMSRGSQIAEQRRGALDTARLGSFEDARRRAQEQRTSLMQSAISAAPTGEKYAAGRAADLRASDAPYRRMLAERADIQDIAGNVGKGFFDISDEEIRKRQQLLKNRA